MMFGSSNKAKVNAQRFSAVYGITEQEVLTGHHKRFNGLFGKVVIGFEPAVF